MSRTSFQGPPGGEGVLTGVRLRNIEDNDEVDRLQGYDIDASTPLWQHDKAWIRRPAQLARAIWQSRFLSRLNFITSHYAYFIIVCLVSSLIFWGSSRPGRSISYVDSLFMVVSAMTSAGLRTVNLSQATTWQQVLIFLLIICGSRIWVSICIVYTRKRRFDQRFAEIVSGERSRRRRRPQTRTRTSSPEELPVHRIHSETHSIRRTASLHSEAQSVRGAASPHAPAITFNSDIEATPNVQTKEKNDGSEDIPYLSRTPTIGRERKYFDLTSEQRDYLGGIEYRSLKLLSILLLLYFFLWQLFGCIALGAWINNNLPGPALDNGTKPWWLGIFNGVSAFNNNGLSLLDASMVPFQDSYFVIIIMGLMILAGNTAFPIFFRFIIWSQTMFLSPGRRLWEDMRFILDHPRRLYIYLFPRQATWWLVFILVLFNSINWVGFVLFGLHNSNIQSIQTGPRVLAGLFQALSIRFGGFHIIKISNLHIGLQLLYMITMFIQAFPIKRSTRRTNVYEERSLGIYGTRADDDLAQDPNESPSNLSIFLQIYKQITQNETLMLMLTVGVIVTIEAGQFSRDPVHYSVFNVMFEVMSAYYGVGVSVGLPDVDYSFSGGWHVASKVILCGVMLLGRHRGLPQAIDKAILLPGESLAMAEG